MGENIINKKYMKFNKQPINLSEDELRSICNKINSYITDNYHPINIYDEQFETNHGDFILPIEIDNKPYNLKLIMMTGEDLSLDFSNMNPNITNPGQVIFELEYDNGQILNFTCSYYSNSYSEDYGEIYNKLLPAIQTIKVINIWETIE